MRIKGRMRSLWSSKCWMSRTHKFRVARQFTAPKCWWAASLEQFGSVESILLSSEIPHIPTFGGRAGLSFALELPKQPHSTRRRVQDTTRFSYHMNGHLSKVRLRRDYVTYKRAGYPRHYLFHTFIMIELVFLQP